VLVWTVGIILAIVVGFPGLSTSKAFGVLAIGSVAFGFAFRDLAENMFAGVLLLSQFPFGHGDFIDSGATSGTVEEVNLRMTKLRTVSGELVVVPNAVLYRGQISILTDSDNRRTTVDVTIAYGSDLASAASVIEEAIQGCDSVVDDPRPEALPWEFAASGVTMRVAWWTSPRPLEIRRSRADVVGAVYVALADADIEIPYPHRTVAVEGPLVLESGVLENHAAADSA